MAYEQYYQNGWKNNEEGGTPITAAALNHTDAGIAANADAIDEMKSALKIVAGAVAFVSGEAVASVMKRAYEAGLFALETPFIGRVTSGSRYFVTGYLYISNGSLYGAVLAGSLSKWSLVTVNNGTWSAQSNL